MDAVKFLEEYKRMCDSIDSCGSCPAQGQCMYGFGTNNAAGVVAITEKWSKEHPRKTRNSEFLKHYPNAINCEGVLSICPKWVDESYNPCNGCSKIDCDDCKEEYWMQEVE